MCASTSCSRLPRVRSGRCAWTPRKPPVSAMSAMPCPMPCGRPAHAGTKAHRSNYGSRTTMASGAAWSCELPRSVGRFRGNEGGDRIAGGKCLFQRLVLVLTGVLLARLLLRVRFLMGRLAVVGVLHILAVMGHVGLLVRVGTMERHVA